MTWHIRATVLPEGVARDLWFTEDRLSLEPLPGARTLHEGGYVVPGLVDVHTHPGTVAIGEPLDDAQLRADADAHVRSGTAVVRVPGSASRLPTWFGEGPGHPRVVQAGLPVAVAGRFFPGWGRQVPVEEVPEAAAAEAAATGWCKLIADWFADDGSYAQAIPDDVMAAAVKAVRAVGGRVAVHAQSAGGGRAAVRAGVDSVEHGMHLPLDVLPAMADGGVALVPTATTFLAARPQMDGDEVPAGLRDWFVEGLDRHADLVRAAVDAGVTVLAGTDLPPGSLTEEVRWLAAAGMSPHDALGAASWTARRWLGLPGVEDGAPADLLVLPGDPREDLTLLDHPELVVVRGRVVEQVARAPRPVVGRAADDVAGGPGWVIDGTTLLPRVTDVEQLREGLAQDPLGEAVELLWTGRPAAAESLLRRHEPTLRVRALLADCRRDSGDVTGAVDDYRRLVAESGGTPWEAVVRQHLGKALFVAGRVADAAEEFARALALREAAGAEEGLLASSRHALRVATRRLAD